MAKPSPAATITVEWGYDNHTVTLTPRNWSRGSNGSMLSESDRQARMNGRALRRVT